MIRFSLGANRTLATALLVAYVALAGVGQLAHTEALRPGPDTAARPAAHGPLPHHRTVPLTLRASAATHNDDRDCLACVWASHNHRGLAVVPETGVTPPPVPHLVAAPVAAYAAPACNLSPIRAPPSA